MDVRGRRGNVSSSWNEGDGFGCEVGNLGAHWMSAPTEFVALDVQDAAIEAYAPGLRRYFSKRVPANDIDDLVQEVFLRMKVHGDNSPIEHLDRYLFRVAASVLSDQARRRMARHHGAHESLEESHHPIEDLTPERVLLDQEALEVVVAAIADLPARTREVFVLHRFEEMTCGNIATLFGMSVSAVEKHIMRALRFLHGRLGAD
jgi:RNA polymerase sigma-70 factor (ECF subfamily)